MTYNYLQSTASSRARYNATLAQHQKSTKPPVWTSHDNIIQSAKPASQLKPLAPGHHRLADFKKFATANYAKWVANPKSWVPDAALLNYMSPNDLFGAKTFTEYYSALVSFRPTGPDSIARLNEGAAAKPHSILEKTIKMGSLQAAYGQQAPAIYGSLLAHGLNGLAGHWQYKNGQPTHLKGIYMSKEMNQHFLINGHGPLVKSIEGQTKMGYYPLDAFNLAHSMPPLHQLPKFVQACVAGDHDMHDMVNLSGPRGLVPSGSATEREYITALNGVFAIVNQGQPGAGLRVLHGPQCGYRGFMAAEEPGKPIDPAVLAASLPVTVVVDGKFTVANTIGELAAIYDAHGSKIKEFWIRDSRTRDSRTHDSRTLDSRTLDSEKRRQTDPLIAPPRHQEPRRTSARV